MATRLKTIEYGIPQLDTLADNTVTAMTTITAYIPEFSGTVTIRKAIVEISVVDSSTTLGAFNSRRIDVSVGGATATSYTNSNVYTGSGEQTCVFYAANATTHFTTNWTTGTSKTIAISVLVDSASASGIILNNVGATLYITYEYDDTQTTQIKTVYIPLNAPVTTLATSKPGTATDTIPNLDTYCPESTKTYRNMFIVCQNNINNTASTVDSTLSMQIDTLTAYTTQTMEMGATSDYWLRLVWTHKYYDSGGSSAGIGMTTNATHGFYIWASVARHNHPQAYMVVTYEFDATGSTNCLVSVLLAAEGNVMGGTTSSDFQRSSKDFWIEEPATVTTRQVAFYAFWEQAANIGGLNMRIGTGSFVTYTDTSAVMCGGNGAMIRNDSAFTLARGKNTLNFDVYRTDAADFGWGLNGFFIVNYECGKPTQGYGAANHTVKWNAGFTFDGAAATDRKTSAFAINIPETSYFLNGYIGMLKHMTNTTGLYTGAILRLERTNAAGQWSPCFEINAHTDAETGLHTHCSGVMDVMQQYPSDPTPNLLDPEGTRRWWFLYSGAATGFMYLDLMVTYHTITFTASGTVSGSAGGTVNIALWRTTENKKALTTSRTGDGSYSITWYDNTETLFTEAREDSTHIGRSDNGTAA